MWRDRAVSIIDSRACIVGAGLAPPCGGAGQSLVKRFSPRLWSLSPPWAGAW